MTFFERFWAADWRLRLYTLSVPNFWFLALGPGAEGASGVKVEGEGAVITALLLIPLWRGSNWAVTLLGLLALGTTMVIGSIGVPPWGPTFGSLALLSGTQFLLLFTYDLGPNSSADDVAERPRLRRAAAPLGR